MIAGGVSRSATGKRSLLVLAGANQRYRPLRSAAPQPEDGLLTAYEARDLDLRGTDLVLLVGCESSVGAVTRTNWHFPANTVMAAGMGMQASGTGQGCKAVVGSRLKRSGMFWSVRGANAIIALRCRRLNGRFEDYWEVARAA